MKVSSKRSIRLGAALVLIASGAFTAKPARAYCVQEPIPYTDSTTLICEDDPKPAPTPTPPGPPAPPPCMVAQNAMRPCTPDQRQPRRKVKQVVGIDPNVVGTWTYQQPGGLWFLEVTKAGTYNFHSEAGDGAPAHTGSFGAVKGHWSLAAITGIPGYMDGGDYTLQKPDTWVMTGGLGTGVWHRQSGKGSPPAAASGPTSNPPSGKR